MYIDVFTFRLYTIANHFSLFSDSPYGDVFGLPCRADPYTGHDISTELRVHHISYFLKSIFILVNNESSCILNYVLSSQKFTMI